MIERILKWFGYVPAYKLNHVERGRLELEKELEQLEKELRELDETSKDWKKAAISIFNRYRWQKQ